MKKLFVFLVIVSAFVAFSCASAPPPASSSARTSSPAPAATPASTPAPAPAPAAETPSRPAGGATQGSNSTNLDLSDAQDYTVVRGDTLSQITRRYYGRLTDVGAAGTTNGFYFPVLMLASTESDIVDPDLIEIGMKLKVPDLKKNLASPISRRAIIDCLKEAANIYRRKGKPDEEQGLLRLANSL